MTKISLKSSSYLCLWTTNLSRWQAIITQTSNKILLDKAMAVWVKISADDILKYFLIFFLSLDNAYFLEKIRTLSPNVVCWIFPECGNGKRQTFLRMCENGSHPESYQKIWGTRFQTSKLVDILCVIFSDTQILVLSVLLSAIKIGYLRIQMCFLSMN